MSSVFLYACSKAACRVAERNALPFKKKNCMARLPLPAWGAETKPETPIPSLSPSQASISLALSRPKRA